MKTIFNFFRKNVATASTQEATVQNHTFSVNELESMYNNQRDLTEAQRKVLNAAMWVRARMANYYGYAPNWFNVKIQDGILFYFENGEQKRIPA